MTLFDNPTYQLSPDGAFVITHYNIAKPFASFFPGIAGADGIPMWLFYVNRGQCVCSMGLEGKHRPIMEFLSANRAYQLTSSQGFRTFIKLLNDEKITFYEPFQNYLIDRDMPRTQRMIIRPAQLTLEEVNEALGLTFTVDYFNVPNDCYAGLIRVLCIQNTSAAAIRLEGLDGLPLIIPYGVDDMNLKHTRRLVEAFVQVKNCDRQAPYFKIKVEQVDRPEVVMVKAGNFYVGAELGDSSARLVHVIVDPVRIFGDLTDYSYPAEFLRLTPYRAQDAQIMENRLPCAMGAFVAEIPAGGAYTYVSVIGHIQSEEALNQMVPSITQPAYIARKRQENTELIYRLTQNNWVCSNDPAFDFYCLQNFLDNVMRGGFPITLQGNGVRTPFYLYSRKHGDLERDYNYYHISATHYSQGDANFRDVNQNRRSDVCFNPDIAEYNVELFYNLLQLDGFNPLHVKRTRFRIQDPARVEAVLQQFVPAAHVQTVREFLQTLFMPGDLLAFMDAQGIELQHERSAFLGELLAVCDAHPEAAFGEGYWTDHWTYNLDLLENYLAMYPERLRYILLEKASFTFYDSDHRVQPRRDKYVLWEGNPMQLGSVVVDAEKEVIIKQRNSEPHTVRTQWGAGPVYRTTLINKLTCLIVNKLASLDSAGVGIEMEADRPNWNDALNGLPGQFGSSINETLELERLVHFLLQALDDLNLAGQHWQIAVEIHDFMTRLDALLQAAPTPFVFWDQAYTIKEDLRALTRLGLSGQEASVSGADFKDFLTRVLNKLNAGIEQAWDKKTGVIQTYFINRPKAYEEIMETGPDGQPQVKRNSRGLPCIHVSRFEQVPLSLFLEGPVHFLRVARDLQKARQLFQNVRASGLYDRKLNMYKVNESLSDQPMEIGRIKTFSPGWFENESIWLHMEYKYLLELVRCGLYEEFYQDLRHMGIPFLDPAMYGRSILENSSFLASSANPDASLHG
ncbi:MAG: cellobiose phosphorylase, partial [Thermoplasmata archaeon]|nr:cellobiose phosphorylase [Thermoplasmata archaeon]